MCTNEHIFIQASCWTSVRRWRTSRPRLNYSSSGSFGIQHSSIASTDGPVTLAVLVLWAQKAAVKARIIFALSVNRRAARVPAAHPLITRAARSGLFWNGGQEGREPRRQALGYSLIRVKASTVSRDCLHSVGYISTVFIRAPQWTSFTSLCIALLFSGNTLFVRVINHFASGKLCQSCLFSVTTSLMH